MLDLSTMKSEVPQFLFSHRFRVYHLEAYFLIQTNLSDNNWLQRNLRLYRCKLAVIHLS